MTTNLNLKIRDIKFKNYLDYLNDDLIILRYWDKTTNFGDFMNPFLVESLLNKPVVSSFKFINFLGRTELLGMGSIIGGDMSKCIIWGSGIMVPDVKISAKPKKVLHVRGKKTQEILRNHGIKTPDLYGDPAFLLPEIIKPKKETEYKLGVVPHYREVDYPIIDRLRKERVEEILVINPLDPFRDIIKNINKCEFITSSSLHGLIVAEAYNIPTLRFHLSDKVGGGDFKFDDHYSGLNIKKHYKFSLQDIDSLHTPSFYELFTLKEIPIDAQKLIMNLQETFS